MSKGRKSRTIPDNAVIQKCKPMFYNLWSEKNRISMTEYKILDIYMGAINSHDINTKEVLIDTKHLKELLGTTYTVSDLRVIFLKLLSLSVRVTDKILISLFSKAEIIENENSELQVLLKCTDEAMQYFFNIDTIGYFSYKLKNILAINSVHSYIIFNYIEKRRNDFNDKNKFSNYYDEHGNLIFETDIDELKELLKCNDQFYNQFKYFNDEVLKKIYKELNSNTSCRYAYETVKNGRYVVAIKFIVAPLQDINPVVIEDNINKHIDYFEQNEIPNTNVNPENIDVLDKAKALLIKRITSENISLTVANHILDRALNDLELYQLTVEVSNPIAYLAARVDKYIMLEKSQSEVNTKQQSYDISEFEKFAITFSGNTKKVDDI